MMEKTCPLCHLSHWKVLWEDSSLFVIHADEKDWPGFIRVIIKDHIKEMSDLSFEDRRHLMEVVNVVEKTIRDIMVPDKINLAELGNMVPHVHWHVIPRYKDDATFPDAIWAVPKRSPSIEQLSERRTKEALLLKKLPQRLNSAFSASSHTA